jgi:hypothetical protein
MKCRSDELSKAGASALINHLKELQRPSELEKMPLHQVPLNDDQQQEAKIEAMRSDIDHGLRSVGIAPEEWLARFDSNCETFDSKVSAHKAVQQKVRETKIKLIIQSWDNQGWSASDRLNEQRKFGVVGNLDNADDTSLQSMYADYLKARQIIIK